MNAEGQAGAHVRACRECGCTDLRAWLGADGLPCHWAEPDLCSACAASDGVNLLGSGPEPIGPRVPDGTANE